MAVKGDNAGVEEGNVNSVRTPVVFRLPGLLALMAAGLFIGVTVGFRMEVISFDVLMRTMRALVYGLVALGVSGGGVGIACLLLPWRLTGGLTLLISCVCLGLAAGPVKMHMKARTVPPIHDITTSAAYAPAFVETVPLREGASNPSAYDPSQYEAQAQAYPDIKTRVYAEYDHVAVFYAALGAIKEMGLEIVGSEVNEGRIEAVDTSLWFGFKDDVIIIVNRFSQNVEVDMRSKSRFGRSDLGVNAQRIRVFFETLDAQLETLHETPSAE